MPDLTPLVTAEELERFPDDDYRYELVEGRVLRMSPVGFEHGRLVVRLAALLDRHVREHDLGLVVIEVGFTLARKPDTVRGPDVAFLSKARIPSPVPTGFVQGSPDLALEVLSPDDRPSSVRRKVEQYLTSGASLVVIVDPAHHAVTLHRRLSPPVTVRRNDDRLDLGDVVPGFSCTLADFFE
jgi:Uma2 family endonuclease